MAGENQRELSPAEAETRELRLPVLYGITDSRGERNLAAIDAVRMLLAGGVRLIQVREKAGDVRLRLAAVTEAVALIKSMRGTVIVNDRSDMALLSGADGVHLGEDDLNASEARLVLGATALIGVSTHSVESCRKSMETSDARKGAAPWAASYVALGPIFATGSKSTAHAPLGLAAIEQAARHKTRPLVVIGGLTPRHVGSCLAAGADSVAMIAGLLDGDPASNVRDALESARLAGFGERE